MSKPESISEYFEGSNQRAVGGWDVIADPSEADNPYGRGFSGFTSAIPGDGTTTRDPFHDADMARRGERLAEDHNSGPPELLGDVNVQTTLLGDMKRSEDVVRRDELQRSAEFRRAAGLPDIQDIDN